MQNRASLNLNIYEDNSFKLEAFNWTIITFLRALNVTIFNSKPVKMHDFNFLTSKIKYLLQLEIFS